MELWVKGVQHDAYLGTIRSLQKENPVNSTLEEFSPFLDEFRFIRVGVRQRNALLLTKMTKHPMILPKHSYLSSLIVRNAQQRTLY